MSQETPPTQLLEYTIYPPGGWIRHQRLKLGITGKQLAASMGVTKQRVSALEKAEVNGATSIKTLQEAAEALGCEFVYAIIPKGESAPPSPDTAPMFIDIQSCIDHQCDQRIIDLCSEYRINSLCVYGSAARGERSDDSAINLLAEYHRL